MYCPYNPSTMDPPTGTLSQPWQFTSLDLRMAYQAKVLLWPIGHIHHQWPIWPRHHLMDHLSFGDFMALHLNLEAMRHFRPNWVLLVISLKTRGNGPNGCFAHLGS
ncbi:hypothetical protein O181_131846 [Austropuccinia psidii MF-1]|uniref:Uncharacterized protein n=1 Tax=Austropuccinia psidii MF-1 TaxID=1389203 RepID=A0A9Q3QAP9_9BASI|nr:hypothetical protein [Austropuccinia psidii MF-1]